MLLNTLKEKGHDEFIKALRNQKETGFVRAQGRLAQRTPLPEHSTLRRLAERKGKRSTI